ncbi:MAG: ABC transporter ATP-binding protein [Candidatus Gracilibacteria bacterium]|nr:ABC transporter ATP-binding protein [Candidatus Gracilibacteria bacterium]
MIEIKNLKVGVLDKEILKGISLNFEIGKNYCLLGKNGSGKSTLSSFLMGHPKYEYISGSVNIIEHTGHQTCAVSLHKGLDSIENSNDNSRDAPCGCPVSVNLLDLSPEERSRAGLFLSFQNVPEIKGIKLSEYLRTIYNISLKNTNSEVKELSPFIFKRFIKKHLEELHIDERFMDRELNVGFSGGEKRKIEILQMKLIGPKYIILDEIDSGLDLDAFRTIAEMLKQLSNENNTFIVITHYFNILEYIDVDKVYVLNDGLVVREGGKELIDDIKINGYK